MKRFSYWCNKIIDARNEVKISTSDIISTQDLITINDHGYSTGDLVTYNNSGFSSANPLLNNTDYYVIKVNNNQIKLALDLSSANSNIPIDITSLGNNSQRFLAKITLHLGKSNNEEISSINADTNITINNYKKGIKAKKSAKSKKVSVKSNYNTFIGFYLPGINLYIDEYRTLDIQFLEKVSRLDVDTKDSPAELKVTEFRISPKRYSSNQEKIPLDETELETFLNTFLYSNEDDLDTTYNDGDGKVTNDERLELSNKIDQSILIVKDFYLSPYLNM